MKVVFVSNFFNHHQKPFSDAMAELTDYKFVETDQISEERVSLGWGNIDIPQYVLKANNNQETLQKARIIIDEADVVIWGSAPYSFLRKRLRKGKLTFVYSERLYKSGFRYIEQPARAVKQWIKFGRFKNVYLLCSSAYTSADYAKTFTFLKKAYKWGYFPETKLYTDLSSIIRSKQPGSILWVARLIECKHPDVPILVAERLKAEGYKFELNIIGNGELDNSLRHLIGEKDLGDCVHMLGAMSPNNVREYMVKSSVFMFTSDFNEGWGAVLNESMNSACAVVASHAIGAVPFLIKDGENGLIYENGNIDDLLKKVKVLLDNTAYAQQLGRNAYLTITEQWNAEIAANRFCKLSQSFLAGDTSCRLFSEGPCSKAKLIGDGWYGKPIEWCIKEKQF